jgi:hypothetical protein
MTHDRPTALELLEAVTEFLAGEIAPTLDDQRLRFRTLVAINALGIAYRELEEARTAAPAGAAAPGETASASNSLLLGTEELTDLSARIRAGEAPPDALALLKEHVAAKLRVSNPRALERYGEPR